MESDEVQRLRAENAALKEELAVVKAQWERELIVAKASLLSTQEELEAARAKLRASLLRNIEAEDDVFNVREEAAQAVKIALEQ